MRNTETRKVSVEALKKEILRRQRAIPKLTDKRDALNCQIAELEALGAVKPAARHRKIDPLPAEFGSEDEAAEFWDTHSITDYEEFLEPVGLEADIKRRHFEIEVDEESFSALREGAKRQHKPAKQLASEILRQKLARS